MSPWGCRDLHFVITHSSGSKTATEQLDAEQCVFKPWAGYALKISLSIISICMVPPAVGRAAAAVTTATHHQLQKPIHCAFTCVGVGLHRSDVHIRVCMLICVCMLVSGVGPSPERTKLCCHPAAKPSFHKVFMLKSQKHHDQTTVSEQS